MNRLRVSCILVLVLALTVTCATASERKPILGAAMGNLGQNMHFFVLPDGTKSSQRLLDPYRKGRIHVQLTAHDDTSVTADIELPLNVLFIPRICPNGKEAHVSWNYCPWSGASLGD